MCKEEATDALMATIGEYDALWDGVLNPEVFDAEFCDCGDWGPSICLPVEMHMKSDPKLEQQFDRIQALAALMGTVSAMVENSLDAPLFEEGVDAELFDCPLNDETFFQCFVAPDFPTPRSLK